MRRVRDGEATSSVSHGNEVLARHWLDEAAKCVEAARCCRNLPHMVKLVATASFLESAARRLCMGVSESDFQKVAELARQAVCDPSQKTSGVPPCDPPTGANSKMIHSRESWREARAISPVGTQRNS
jgi:hypothetical protein